MAHEQNKMTGSLDRYIEFSLGKDDFAIPLLIVREVISLPDTTVIPNAPEYFVGIMNLRGQVITIVDLRKKLKISSPSLVNECAVIIINLENVQVGIVVDSINKVLSFDRENIHGVPTIESELNSEYIVGVYRKENTLTVLIDLAKVLDLDEIGQNKSNDIAA